MTAHWFSFGDCPCAAHTIIEIRIEPGTANLAPVCPACGAILRYRDHWPAPRDGFGGSSGGLDEIIGRMRRVIERYPDDPTCAELGVALDAWEAQRRTPAAAEIADPAPTLDSIAEAMKCNGIPASFTGWVKGVAEKSEGADDLMHLWLEASDEDERNAIEYDLFRLLLDRLPREKRESYLRGVRILIAKTATAEEVAMRCELPVSVVHRLKHTGIPSYMGVP